MVTLARTVGAFVALIIGLVILVNWAAEYLWLETLGYESVFWTLRALKVGLFAAAFVPIFLYFWINFRILTRRLDFDAMFEVLMGQSTVLADDSDTFMRPEDDGGRHRMPVLLFLAAVAIALIFALVLYSQWDTLLRFQWSRAYGESDPIFDRDIGFYLFRLPFLELQQNGLAVASLLGSVFVVLAYAYAGALRVDWRQGVEASPAVLWHVAVNLALFLVARAWGYYLDRFALLQSTDGVVHGAGYTDVFVTRPALWIVVGATITLAVAVLVPRLFTRAGMALTALGGYLLIVFACLGVAPWVVQGFVVKPNELQRETPFLRHNIAFTRKAFGLDRVEERPHAGTSQLSMAAIERSRQTIDNVRLWDWRPLSQTFRQLQQIRTYYQFNKVDVDRYRIDGEYRQVMLSARELSGRLPGRSETWLNRRLQYTHGYGLVMSLTAEKDDQGGPVLLIKDLPPVSDGGLSVTEPAIYYGEDMSGYRIVATAVKELDHPRGDENVYSSYGGHGGVRLDPWWKQVLFAAQQLDISILLSGYITPRSRIQLWRPVQERVERIAPFLQLDDDPYLVLGDGRLYWIQDAYTTSDGFPYSEPHQDRFNYIRNSVKVVVDAYDGDTTFYVIDEEDPVLRVYRDALPVLFRALGDMPETLRRHLRYPRDLFDAQVAKYITYHMTVPQVFYNGEDIWAVPLEKYGGEQIAMQPYYILIKLPGEDRLQFMLMTPLTPNSRDNMIAWMAARSDFPGYGELVVYKLSKERLIIGPIQAEAKIDQDTLVSQQLSLWDQRGSRVIRGNLLVVPVEDSFIYVEPVYLISEGINIPQLKRVIVTDGDRLAMEPTLKGAIQAVYGQAPRTRPALPVAAAGDSGRPEARSQLERAEEALRRGDWDAFGRAMQKLKGLLGG